MEVLSNELADKSVIWRWDLIGTEADCSGRESPSFPPLAKVNRLNFPHLPAHEHICCNGRLKGVLRPSKWSVLCRAVVATAYWWGL